MPDLQVSKATLAPSGDSACCSTVSNLDDANQPPKESRVMPSSSFFQLIYAANTAETDTLIGATS
jgi:hypothetical protein